MNMRCMKCNAQDKKYFIDGICRRCIHLSYGVLESYDWVQSDHSEYSLDFEMTLYQKDIAKKIVKAIQKQDVYLEAVCGAGKTEMCYELISHCIQNKLVLAWAIPRRQVVLELKDRIAKNFKNCKVVAVCQGYTEDLLGDVIVCTTHQLYRYPQMIDILIVDEPDAFPFSGNELLLGLMQRAIRGNVLFMSATRDEKMLEILKNPKHLVMPLRPNLKPLPIPVHRFMTLYFVYDFYKHRNEKRLIFVPTIKMAESLSKVLKSACITSKSEDKDALIEKFANDPQGTLISTTILERGVTFKNVFVFILKGDHVVFNEASLTQISGRILRGNSTKGACYIYTKSRCLEVEKCIQSLENNNQLAKSVLKQGM